MTVRGGGDGVLEGFLLGYFGAACRVQETALPVTFLAVPC
jgi:hypothetical protein